MIEPFTIMGTAALTEAVKLVMNQAQKVLASLRRRRKVGVD